MKHIQLNFQKETQLNEETSLSREDKSLLFSLPTDGIFLLKNHFSKIGKHLLTLVHQDDDKRVFDLDPENLEDRNFFWKLKSELIELSHYLESKLEDEFMEGDDRYYSLFHDQDQKALQRFIKWCDNHAIHLEILFENNFFE